MRGKVITGVHNLPSDNLVLFVTGFSEFVFHGTQGLYHQQIEDLLTRGYDVVILDLPSHSSFGALSFSNPENFHRKMFEVLSNLYQQNAKRRFKVLALSSAATVFTHCWANGASEFISGVCFVNPAFEFRKPIFIKLLMILASYYSLLFLSFVLGLIFWPSFILFPVLFFAMRILKCKKTNIRPEEIAPTLDKDPCYPLVASAKLVFMQLVARRAVKKHALFPMPTLIICAENDPLFTYHYAQRLFENDLRAKFLIIQSAKHSLLLTHWDEPSLQKAWNDFFHRF